MVNFPYKEPNFELDQSRLLVIEVADIKTTQTLLQIIKNGNFNNIKFSST